jgi:hypothetical protein
MLHVETGRNGPQRGTPHREPPFSATHDLRVLCVLAHVKAVTLTLPTRLGTK